MPQIAEKYFISICCYLYAFLREKIDVAMIRKKQNKEVRIYLIDKRTGLMLITKDYFNQRLRANTITKMHL